MATQHPPVKNAAYSFEIGLYSQADPTAFKSGATLAAGDFKISKDGGALANLTNLPTASGNMVLIVLTSTEMNADRVHLEWQDAAGAEWISGYLDLFTAATSQDALLTTALAEAYSTDGSTITVSQALYEIISLLQEFSVSGTTVTLKKRDGSTSWATLTVDSATTPTSITRAT